MHYDNQGPLKQQINGSFNYDVSYPMAAFTDGTSQTFLFGERAHGLLIAGRSALVALVGRRRHRRHAVLDALPVEPPPQDPQHLGRMVGGLRLGGVELPPGRSQLRLRRRLGPVRQGHHQHLALRPDLGLPQGREHHRVAASTSWLPGHSRGSTRRSRRGTEGKWSARIHTDWAEGITGAARPHRSGVASQILIDAVVAWPAPGAGRRG